ncbi:MAG: hypothetical protein BWX66_01858 [Deltaproteobacteria bacterium ADurb.Bin058]|jgi:hypothetical protein|nr:MAG: hypothetical protein BWX66_01858 [Deltaproteobacteria bacterium ADurb.Bin058]
MVNIAVVLDITTVLFPTTGCSLFLVAITIFAELTQSLVTLGMANTWDWLKLSDVIIWIKEVKDVRGCRKVVA